MSRLTLSRRALLHLHAIGDFIARDDRAAADEFIESVVQECRRRAIFPRIGHARPDLGRGCRAWVVGRYLIVYRVRRNRVEIAGVVHAKRNLARFRF